jgi:D-threo-aldose 1-dehydrogenase
MPENFGYEVAERDAVALVRTVLDGPIRALDTANGYSLGRSEQRIGAAIAASGGLPRDFLLTTKVDAQGRDYSGDRVRESIHESTERLGIGTLPMVYLHDPEFHDFDVMTASGGAVDALVDARERGLVGHIGVAGGDVRELARYLDLEVFEVLLTHNRWTLVDRSAGALVDRAADEGVAVVNAAVYGGGILATPRREDRTYGYRPASAATSDAVLRMADACERHGTDLATAAVRFSTRDERIASTVVGVSKPARIAPLVAAATAELPDELWAELEALTPSPEHWLDARP